MMILPDLSTVLCGASLVSTMSWAVCSSAPATPTELSPVTWKRRSPRHASSGDRYCSGDGSYRAANQETKVPTPRTHLRESVALADVPRPQQLRPQLQRGQPGGEGRGSGGSDHREHRPVPRPRTLQGAHHLQSYALELVQLFCLIGNNATSRRKENVEKQSA